MVVVVAEAAPHAKREINDKMRRLTCDSRQDADASTQEVIDQVLWHLVESLGATHGMLR